MRYDDGKGCQCDNCKRTQGHPVVVNGITEADAEENE